MELDTASGCVGGDIFSRLQFWFAEHVGMPQRGSDDTVEVSLAQWVNKQRIAKNSGVLVADRVHALETLPDWSWTPHADVWIDVFSRQQKMDCRIWDAKKKFRERRGGRIGDMGAQPAKRTAEKQSV